MEIIKLINSKDEASVKESNFNLPLSWEHLLPAIEKAVLLRSDELIDGLIISKEGIEVKVSRKKGRKISMKEDIELFNQNGGGE